MAEVEMMKDLDSIADVVPISLQSVTEEFFDAVSTDDVQSKNPAEENGSGGDSREENEADFLKEIEEAIGDTANDAQICAPPAKKICIEEIRSGIENGEVSTAVSALDTVDDLLVSEKEFLDSIIDEKAEKELQDEKQDESDGHCEPASAVEMEDVKVEEITPAEQAEEAAAAAPNSIVEESGEKDRDSAQSEESNEQLLELCDNELKKEQNDITELDKASTQSGDATTKKNAGDMVGTESSIKTDASGSTTNEDDREQSDAASSAVEDNTGEEEQKRSIGDENEENQLDDDDDDEDKKMVIDETSDNKSISQDVEMAEDKSNAPETKESSSQFDSCEAVIAKQPKDEPKPLDPVNFTFLKKFATSMGKLTRAELEELVMAKITEAIVYFSKYTESRIQCEKQEEIIENLKTKIATLQKQYNDMDMIHKRIMTDLSARPDQPVTPVKITRAVGLQVYPPSSSSSKSKAPNQSGGVGSGVGGGAAFQNNKSAATASTNKRSNESALNSPKENEIKKKRPAKIITPMRPPLSEKEKASLDQQEASFEQKLRKIISKPDSSQTVAQVTIRPVLAGQRPANGTLNKQIVERTKPMSSPSQPIDLTDDVDEVPPTQPPALVAIQRSNPVLAKATRSPQMPVVRTPDMINRGFTNRSSATRHPAPLPQPPTQPILPGYKKIPPKPTIKISNVPNGIIVSWTVDSLTDEHEKIANYQIYAYEETRALPSTENWKHVGDVKALLLPMAVTLTQFQEGQKYFFAVRAVDIHNRCGHFSMPKTWA